MAKKLPDKDRKKTIVFDIDEAMDLCKAELKKILLPYNAKIRKGTVKQSDVDGLIDGYSQHFTNMDNSVVDFLDEIVMS